MKIIVVDDEEDARIVLKKSLEADGNTVQTALNGEEALKMAREFRPDMIISDILMPVMDGFHLCREVRADPDLKETPFIFYTATYTDEKDKALALKLGADRFIIKPVAPDEFIRLIREISNRVKKKRLWREEPEALAEAEVLKLYSERLVKKLEKKMLDLGKEVASRKKTEEALQKSEERLALKNRIAQIFLMVPDDQVYGESLQIILAEMQSTYGVLGYIDEDGALVCPSMTREIWDRCRVADKDYVFPHEAWAGIWGRSLIEKKSLYSNEPLHVPKGHIPLDRALCVPILHQGECIGSITVGNKTSDYLAEDKDVLEGIAAYIAPVLQARVQRDRQEKEKERLESRLRQAEKMEAIGTLAGGIAHDFNNLLMGMQGHASMILMNKASHHPDFGHLKGIEENIKRASDLTRQLLGFARGGRYEVKPANLNELVKKAADMFGQTKKEITIHRKSQPDTWTVAVDRNQIEQVLLNLFINAWQAMSGTGEIYLETENVTLDEIFVKPYGTQPGRYVKIAVTDTGIGMDKATQKRVFDPFFTTKEMDRGTGLGLASAYGIVKNHGGIITVYSEKEKGTTFKIYLPAVDATGWLPGEETERPADFRRGTERVLLIDDEEIIIDVGKDLLKALGYAVLTAKSGKEGIEIYRKKKDQIDMVILDMIMPVMSGSETFDRLKKIDPGIKVLLSSGYSIDSPAKDILARGCSGFIQKPFNMRQLSEKLREILT